MKKQSVHAVVQDGVWEISWGGLWLCLCFDVFFFICSFLMLFLVFFLRSLKSMQDLLRVINSFIAAAG